MKLVIVGGGSSYTPELVHGLLEDYGSFQVDEICLMDINMDRLEIIGGLSQRMVAKSGLPVQITTEHDLKKALSDASFVNCLIRVGGMDARIQDEKIPLKYGVLGQETTGPGGMMKALRTIPPMLQVAKEMESVCPDAWLINYTNPSGIVAEALGKYSRVRYVGLCSGPKLWIGQILAAMGVKPEEATVDWVGLNHLGFATRVMVNGQDRTQEAIETVAGHWNVDGEWIRALGAIPATYLRYFYHRDKVVEEYNQPGHRTRGEVVKDIEAELLRQYSDPNLAERPELLKKRGGGGYSDVAIAAMKAIRYNSGDRQIVQVSNGGAVDGIPEDASMELSCVVDQAGPHPIRFGPLPMQLRGLIQSVKAYESLTVQAAVEGSSRIAMQALMTHPLVPSWGVAKPMLEELLSANRPWLPWVDNDAAD